jgi:two-component system sensor kinase
MGTDTTAPKSLILVIEDEESINENVCEILKHFGYRVISALDGEQGLQCIRNQRPDLVLCDIMMPNMDGVALLRELRKDDEFMLLPFIFLTAKSQAQDILAGLKTGADDYLPKPFETKELLQAVEFRLQKQKKLLHKSRDEAKLRYLEIASKSSHEMGNILNGLLNGVEILLDDLINQNLDDVDTIMAFIKKAGAQLHSRYHNLEVVHSIHAGTIFKNVDTSATWEVNSVYVNALVKEISTIFPKRTADVNADVSTGYVQISEDHLRKILTEIIGNAFEFSQIGDEIRVIGHTVGNIYKISIIDHGKGMDLTTVDYTKFFHSREINSSQQFGMGLGLYIAHEILSFWKGSMSLQSEPGKGALVILRLPIAIDFDAPS